MSRSHNVDQKNMATITPLATMMATLADELTAPTNAAPSLPRKFSLPLPKFMHASHFPFDIACAMTVHKVQGRTISRVVVDLTCHPRNCGCIKHAAIFVAMSHVSEMDHIRLLKAHTIQQ